MKDESGLNVFDQPQWFGGRCFGLFLVLSFSLSLSLSAFGANALVPSYPVKPIRMIVAVPPGGPADNLARLVVPAMTQSLGQMVVIDNRAGANGNMAYETAARAAPDGYTIVLVAAGVSINPSLYRQVHFDPSKDFVGITQGIALANILVVFPGLPVNTLKGLIDYSRAKAVNFASAGSGSTGHLALELFKISTGLPLVHIPYKGGGPALTEVIAGQVDAMFSLSLAALPQIRSGKVRALAISTLKRSRVAPDIATVAESGVAGFEVVGWFGWLAPAKTDASIINRLNKVLVEAIHDEKIQARLVSLGCEPVGSRAQEFSKFVRDEKEKWASVIKQAGIELN